MDLENKIEAAIKKDFSHEFLESKENVNIAIKGHLIEITDLCSDADIDADFYEEEEDFTKEEYIEEEEAHDDEFFQDAKDFVYSMLLVEVGEKESQKYTIEFN